MSLKCKSSKVKNANGASVQAATTSIYDSVFDLPPLRFEYVAFFPSENFYVAQHKNNS